MHSYVRESELSCRFVQDEAMIVNRATNTWHRLNPVGAMIFEHLEAPASLHGIVDHLQQNLDLSRVPAEEIRDDVQDFITHLLANNLIRDESTPPLPRGRLCLDDWRDDMDATGSELMIPVWAKIEISTRCHLDCVHCYIPGRERHPRGTQKVTHAEKEMSTADIYAAIDQLAEIGSILLTITGGEIFIRRDIIDILQYAHDRGFILELFTSATPLTPAKIATLAALNIGRIQVSIYSHDEATHDAVTTSKGSWKRSIRAVREMVRQGIHVDFASTLMRDNHQDAKALRAFAESLGATCSYGYPITARTDGNRDTHRVRLNDEELQSAITALPEFFALPQLKRPEDRICSAGLNMCSITSTGEVLPCSQFHMPLGNSKRQPIAEIWQNSPALKTWRQIRMKDLKPSEAGSLDRYVGLCPGLNLLEEGDYLVPAKITAETTLAVVDTLES